MTRIPEKPPVAFSGPFVRCGPDDETGTSDDVRGAGIHGLQYPRAARLSPGYRGFGALAPPPWFRAPTPAMAPLPEPPGLRLVVNTPDGDAPIRSGAPVHVFPKR